MTNIYSTADKIDLKRHLFGIAVAALEKAGWKVERVPGSGKSSVRRITKGAQTKIVSIRTTQDQWIAFPRKENDAGWLTLDEVDAVVPVSVDDEEMPKFAKVHLIDGDEMRARFDRAYKARKKAGHAITMGRGVWISLYVPEAQDPVNLVGAGVGLMFPPIATVPLAPQLASAAQPTASRGDDEAHLLLSVPAEEAPLTIAEAKRRLAKTLGVDPINIKISVEA